MGILQEKIEILEVLFEVGQLKVKLETIAEVREIKVKLKRSHGVLKIDFWFIGGVRSEVDRPKGQNETAR